MMISTISLIIPLYNSEPYISKTLESIQSQSLSTWQCIIVDDSSTDKSLEIAASYAEEDHRFSVISRKLYSTQPGANVCRNIGIQHADSENLMFIDSDDVLLENCLRNRLITVNSYPKNNFYIFQTNFMDDTGKITGCFRRSSESISELAIDFIKHKIPWHTMSVVWKKPFLNKLGGWNESYERLQDVELSLRALLYRNPKIYFSDLIPDSNYRSIGMNSRKKQAAKKSFIRLTKYVFQQILISDLFSQTQKKEVLDYLNLQIQSYLANYILTTTKRDSDWENLYLDMLQNVGVELLDIERVKKIFERVCN